MADKSFRKRKSTKNSEYGFPYKCDRKALPSREYNNDNKTNCRESNCGRRDWGNNSTDSVCGQFNNSEISSRNNRNIRYNPCRRYYNYGNWRKPPVLEECITGWYRVNVPNINNPDEVINIIQSYVAPIKFYPYDKQYYNDNSLSFLVDAYSIAITLRNANFKISHNNQKLTIRVYPYYPSHNTISFVPVSDIVKEKIIEAIETRYNPDTKFMDLSQFHTCPLFTDNQLLVPLNRPAVLLAALHLVAQRTKNDLYGLSLENNNIYLGEGLVQIRRLFPDLKELNLAGNKFVDFKDLKSLTGYTIEVFNLSRNPICIPNNEDSYKSNVHKLFPMLKKFDNSELPLQYNTAIEYQLKIPNNLGNSYPVPNGHDPKDTNPITTMVESFIEQYYELYDNNISRKALEIAYCENATFSISSDYLSNANKNSDHFEQYTKYSRNLLKPEQNPKITKNNLIYKGKDKLINFLESLPKTKHDFGSFIIDVPLAIPALVQIVVNGVFNEIGHIKNQFKSFCRTFCLVPFENGWRISNDMMFVTLVSNELLVESSKRFYVSKQQPEILKKETTDHPIDMLTKQMQSFTMDVNASNSNENNNSERESIMVQKFSKESGMNYEWSKKCLVDNGWDYRKSYLCFVELKTCIPPIAFIHTCN